MSIMITSTSKRRIVKNQNATIPSNEQQHYVSYDVVKPRRRQRLRQTRTPKPIWMLLVTGVFICWGLSLWQRPRFQGSSLLFFSRQSAPLVFDETYPVVHVVQTRFMQYQPHLEHLAWARLSLLESITLPSLMKQSNLNFVWIIRTDPDLPEALRRALIELVTPYQNVILAASNRNPEGFKCSDCIQDLIQKELWSGSLHTLVSYWNAAHHRPLMETRLDADDALWLGYVDWLQSELLQTILPNSATGAQWNVFCPLHHMEWHPSYVWNQTTNSTTELPGSVLGLHTPHCVTAGLTWSYGPGTDVHDTPPDKHHEKIHQLVPECVKNKTNTQCLVRVQPPNKVPAALRARTLTSAGLEHVLTGASYMTKVERKFQNQLKRSTWKDTQSQLFAALEPLFAIQTAALNRTRQYLQEHLTIIAQEALEGQCTKGHSCKDWTKTVLQHVVDQGSVRVK